MNKYTITELCADFGITPRAVRFYEERGLLSPTRAGASRIFDRRDYIRLKLIVRGKKYGFSLRQIGELLDLYETPDGPRKQLERVLPDLKFQLKMLQEDYEELGNTIKQLHDNCEAIEERLNDPARNQTACG